MNVALAALKKTYGLSTEPKMYFPHMFNVPANYNIQLEHLPPLEAYCPEEMKPSARKVFEEWYARNFYTPFLLRKELAIYCSNDTAILEETLIKKRQLYLDITGKYDVMAEACTLAGICMRIFKAKFLKKNHISLMAERGIKNFLSNRFFLGIEKADRQSVIAIKYFEYLAEKEKINIQHAGNGLEKRVKINGQTYKLDGYIQNDNKAIEFQGCNLHGCPRHMQREAICINGKVNKQKKKKINFFRKRM